MKKILPLFIGALFVTGSIHAQEKKKAIPDMSNRANDHFMVQLGNAGWSGIPDTINKAGFSKTFNVYFLFDFPFKTNPKLSMAFGPGIATDHMLFGRTHIGIKDPTSTLYFTNQSDTNNFKKTKLATVYLEAPIELRFSAHPETGKGLKLAAGVKVGLLMNVHTRNAKFQTSTGSTINDYVMKEADKRFFNKTRVSGMVRAGVGHFTLFGAYSFTPLIKDGLGPVIHPFSIGINLSGL